MAGCSYLQKKSPAGIKGFRHWQKRSARDLLSSTKLILHSYFQFTRKSKESDKSFLRYYKSHEDMKLISTIPIARVVRVRLLLECAAMRCYRSSLLIRSLCDCLQVQLLPQKRTGCRFDIKMDNSRVYALDASSKKEAKAWCARNIARSACVIALWRARVIRVDLLVTAMANRDKKVTTTSSSTGADNVKWTKFQEFFFKLKYGEFKERESAHSPTPLRTPLVVLAPADPGATTKSKPKDDVEKKREAAIKEMNEKFSTNAHILKYILDNVLDPTVRSRSTAACVPISH